MSHGIKGNALLEQSLGEIFEYVQENLQNGWLISIDIQRDGISVSLYDDEWIKVQVEIGEGECVIKEMCRFSREDQERIDKMIAEAEAEERKMSDD